MLCYVFYHSKNIGGGDTKQKKINKNRSYYLKHKRGKKPNKQKNVSWGHKILNSREIEHQAAIL